MKKPARRGKRKLRCASNAIDTKRTMCGHVARYVHVRPKFLLTGKRKVTEGLEFAWYHIPLCKKHRGGE